MLDHIHTLIARYEKLARQTPATVVIDKADLLLLLEALKAALAAQEGD